MGLAERLSRDGRGAFCILFIIRKPATENMETQEGAKKKYYKKWWFWVGVALVAFVVVVGMTGSSSEPSASTPAPTSAQAGSAQPATPAPAGKQYVQVATFSGTGQKKSEPFTINGDRFKIAYDCKGQPSATYCGAFVFKVGSNLPQGVMNATQAIKDETVIYTSMAGKGEYYIDANVLGTFTMTIYDYK
jgi:hypothetical protein